MTAVPKELSLDLQDERSWIAFPVKNTTTPVRHSALSASTGHLVSSPPSADNHNMGEQVLGFASRQSYQPAKTKLCEIAHIASAAPGAWAPAGAPGR